MLHFSRLSFCSRPVSVDRLTSHGLCHRDCFRSRNFSNWVERDRKPTFTGKQVDWSLLESCPTYDAKYVEDKLLCQRLWDRLGVAKPETVTSRHPDAPVLCMLLPPPNVTGSLHIGHALTCAVQDTLARFHRMRGTAVLWIPGMDHAGIATQAVVERELLNRSHRASSAPGTTPVTNPRLLLGRQAFLDEVWRWKSKQSNRIRQQLTSLGLSLDWTREFFTLDPKHSHAVTEAFVRLYEAGLIYRDTSIVSWCCHFQSAISDIEVDNMELHCATKLPVPGYNEPQTFGIMDYFAYPLAQDEQNHSSHETSIIVATTRLETMLADTALVVHPEDQRYAHLIGHHVIHPFCPKHRRLPIVADAQLVDPDKGTGVVKLSPGHSVVDWDAARRLGLPVLNMLDDAGRINEVGGEFSGLPRFVARHRLVQRLTDLGLYKKREDIALTGQITNLPMCSRSGDIIEPVMREQWFVRTEQLAEQAMQAVREGKLKLYPSYYDTIWYEWLRPYNRRDWCVSRQLWWGHRIPAFRLKSSRGSKLNTHGSSWLVARNSLEIKQQLLATDQTLSPETIELEQDPDVLDTWFSSALLPFTTLGWPDQTVDFGRFYPMTLLETGQDILFFWVARMVMLGLQLTNSLPFTKVVLHGLLCDSKGQKMSKSKGNVVDPLDLVNGIGALPKNLVGSNIQTIGADALRASLLSCSLGQPKVAYNPESALEMRRFCNKIWQTGRFVIPRLQTDTRLQNMFQSDFSSLWEQLGSTCEHMRLADLWLIHRQAELVKHIHKTWSASIEDPTTSYTIHMAVQQLHRWWTEELCSVYLELVKYREKSSSSTDCSLFVLSILTGLHLLHPIMPHVTETVWQGLYHVASTSHRTVSENLWPETCLALQPFPQVAWFRFLECFDPDHADRTNQLMSELLNSASQANAWHVLLRPRSGNNTAPVESSSPSLYLIGPKDSMDTAELMNALTRLTVCEDGHEHPRALRLAIGSEWTLSINPENYDLDWTRAEIQRRLADHKKRHDQVSTQVERNTSQGLEPNRNTLQKLRGFEQRIWELERQLQSLRSNL